MGDTLNIRWSGEKAADAETVGKLLSGFDGLFKAVAEEMGMDPDSVRLEIGSMRLICDGCERTKTPECTGWLKHEGLDYCPSCQTPAMGHSQDERAAT